MCSTLVLIKRCFTVNFACGSPGVKFSCFTNLAKTMIFLGQKVTYSISWT